MNNEKQNPDVGDVRVGGCLSAKKCNDKRTEFNSHNQQDSLGVGPPDQLHRDLADEHRTHRTLTTKQIRWFVGNGVSVEAIARPWPIRHACVVFADDGRFDISDNGEGALTFAVVDSGRVVDLAAWAPRSGRLASWNRQGFCLGQAQVFEAATWSFDAALHIHETPLEWLQAGRRGIVIIEPSWAYAYLAHRPRLSFDTPAFARKVERWLQPPRPLAKLYLTAREDAA